MVVLKQPKYEPILGHLATKIKMQDAIEFYEEFCPTCRGTIVSLKEENHSRKFCPNCTPSSKSAAFHKLNEKLLGRETQLKGIDDFKVVCDERPMKDITPPRKLIK
jgi:reverse gyrase